MPVPETVTRLTGITDDDVRGQTLDDEAVAASAADASLVIAHNAAFDRRFAERRLPIFVDKPWGCSSEQVPWAEEGLRSRSLDYHLHRFGLVLRRSPRNERLPRHAAPAAARPADERPARPGSAAADGEAAQLVSARSSPASS
jgi:DNA polymerase III epsilon subunit-like protein